MKKKSFAWILPAIIVVIALAISVLFNTGDDTPFTSSGTGERGASLLFDTLAHMGYGVRAGYRPLTTSISSEDVFVIIQPRMPRICHCMAEEMLLWVENGGRLVFLCDDHPRTAVNLAENTSGRNVGDFRLYRHGYGEIITGNATPITNIRLMENAAPGEAIQTTLSRWNSEREIRSIFFAEYYHGFHSPETFIGRMPVLMRLMFTQMIFFAIVAIWHLGKRFGNPVPFYEEIEREENEHVRALARLYMNAKGASKFK